MDGDSGSNADRGRRVSQAAHSYGYSHTQGPRTLGLGPRTVALASVPEFATRRAASDVLGSRIAMRRAVPEDRERVWHWLAAGELTGQRFGAPWFPELPPPTFEQFQRRFPDWMFDGSRPFEGRGFVLCESASGEEIGFICHHRLDLLKDIACIDIWLAQARHSGLGVGSEAIRLLCDWIRRERGVSRYVLRPSRRNTRALKAGRRAGFRTTDLPLPQIREKLGLGEGDYPDELLMFLAVPLPTRYLASDSSRCYVFFDSEFTSLEHPELLSVGAVSDAGGQFYAEIADGVASPGSIRERSSDFVIKTVLPLLEGLAQPRSTAAEAFLGWLGQCAEGRPVSIVTDSAYDRWALAALLGREDLPIGVSWQRVPVAYEQIDAIAAESGMRRHHALDDARTLQCAVADLG
jgi:RimJ/RimL family protein N-acetyltransferase